MTVGKDGTVYAPYWSTNLANTQVYGVMLYAFNFLSFASTRTPPLPCGCVAVTECLCVVW